MDKQFAFKVVERRYGFPGQYHFLNTGKIPDKVEISDIGRAEWEEFFYYLQNSFNWQPDNEIRLENHKADGETHITRCIHLDDSITVSYFRGRISLSFDRSSPQEAVDKLKSRLKQINPDISSQGIGIIRDGGGYLEVKNFKYSLPEQSVIGYLNENTQEFHRSMIKQLDAQDGSGLYLLFGKPGTGKTSFIKDVLNKISKKALFISPCFTEELTSPSLISLLMDYPDSILVIEDAETVLMERKADNSSAVSNLLNLTDGFLADFLNLKIICTFNTELNSIDDALLREGRLQGMHEFTKFDPERAQQIANVLDRDIQADRPMTLAEICGSEIDSMEYKPKNIGFSNGFDDIEPPFRN